MKQILRAQPFAITDHHRSLDPHLNKLAGPFGRAVNYVMYRTVLAPVEVSHRWYIFYPEIHGSYLGFYGLTPSSRNDPMFQHPANKVAIWSYASRFPNKYLHSAYAYASIDADAWARWGKIGLIGVAFILLVFRIVAGNVRLEGRFGDSIYTAFLVVFSFSLPMASLQALLQAQGAFYFWLLPIFVWIWNTLRRKYLAQKRGSIFEKH
jgi:hypothetical protein